MVNIVLDKLSDNQLLERYLDGDENAFKELIIRYKNENFAIPVFVNSAYLYSE